MKSVLFLFSSFLFLAIILGTKFFRGHEFMAVAIACTLGIVALKLFKIKIVLNSAIKSNIVILALILAIVNASLTYALHAYFTTSPVVGTYPMFGSMVEKILLVCLLIPLFEEFFFRGILFDDISQKFGNVIAIIITSIIFLYLHIGNHVEGERLISIVFLTPAVIIFAYLRLKTNNFYASFIAHSAHNTTMCTISFFLLEGSFNIE